jgi:hypothetical protein
MFDGRKRKKLEKSRRDTLSAIRAERLAFEEMLQRPRKVMDAVYNDTLAARVRASLTEIEQRASQETDIDELGALSDDAERQGQLRAYVCPREEIRTEGCLAIDLMEEWNVPKTRIDKLRKCIEIPLQNIDTNPDAARSALRTIFEENDSWWHYTSDYEDEMRRFTRWWLGVPILILLGLAIAASHFPMRLPLAVPMLLAGAAGSCVSVMSKMPVLEVSLSGELESYERRILSRIAVGMIASLIGCGLLGWGVISLSIQGQSFSDVLNA